MLSDLISVISIYLEKILVDDVFVSFDYVFGFRSFFIVVIYPVRMRVFLNILFFIADEQESRFRLKKRRKILIFNYLKIWSVRVLLNLIIIIIRYGPIFIILILLFMQLHILIIIRFTNKFPSDIIEESPININFDSDITLTLYLLNEFILNNISIGFENMQT
jgi:hypothetical protein